MDVKMKLLASFSLVAKISSFFARVRVDWLLSKMPIFQSMISSRSIFALLCTNKPFLLTRKCEIFGIFEEKITRFLKIRNLAFSINCNLLLNYLSKNIDCEHYYLIRLFNILRKLKILNNIWKYCN